MPSRALPILAVAAVVLLNPLGKGGAWAQQPAPTTTAEAPPEKVRELLSLMDDPTVRGWLARRAEDQPAAPPAAALSPAASVIEPAMAVRHHIEASIAALPTAGAELARAGSLLYGDLTARGAWTTVLLIGVFLGLGLLAERLYWWATRGFRRQIVAMSLDTVQMRLRAVGRRLVFGLGWVAAFAVGSLGAFLLFEWPPLLRDLIARCLLLCVIVWLTTVVLRFILAPNAERFRILPVSTASARHWYLWLTLIVGWYAAARLTGWFLETLGMAPAVRGLMADLFSLVWLVILLAAAWRRPGLRADANPDPAARAVARGKTWLASFGLVLLWLLVPLGAYRLFSTALTVAALPVLLKITRAAVAHVLRPPGSNTAETVPPLAAVLLERGLRAFWIIGAAVLLGWIWEVNVNSMAGDETVARVLRGALHAVVILLVVDLLWHVLRTWIDRKLAEAQRGGAATGVGDGSPEAAHRRARIRTLLPIARNVLLVVLAVMGVLMALSAVGVEVGPLIAGAGVVGVAIGFGSQTLVKDVISGVFFLLDDAFRVGEYIESGSIRGTVEGFSLRSIKLRHHRGYLHTVPFGSLDKITNYSRDWVIDKVTLGVTYDTDLDRVKRIIKQVGKELQSDPELAPHILETLKMQGVEEYGDFAIKIRLKMMTRPGEQFVVRRRAYALIKKAFAENGVQFAFPTVQVAGGEAQAAAAQTALDGLQKPAA
jgi:small-conductance mechanosensitive channel